MKVIRNKNSPSPCDFSVVLASPRKALELLKQNPTEKFLNFPGVDSKITDRRAQSKSIKQLCDTAKTYKEKQPPPTQVPPSKQKGGVTKVPALPYILVSQAFAGAKPLGVEAREEEYNCAGLTNGDVFNALSSSSLGEYNNLIQKEMDALRIEINQKLKKKLPQCQTDFIEAPSLFHGGEPVETSATSKELPKNMALSILPNVTNSISVNDTVISSETSNTTFKEYIDAEYKKRGNSTSYVDTFDYSHLRQGNLHCSTNTIHICNPRGAK